MSVCNSTKSSTQTSRCRNRLGEKRASIRLTNITNRHLKLQKAFKYCIHFKNLRKFLLWTLLLIMEFYEYLEIDETMTN